MKLNQMEKVMMAAAVCTSVEYRGVHDGRVMYELSRVMQVKTPSGDFSIEMGAPVTHRDGDAIQADTLTVHAKGRPPIVVEGSIEVEGVRRRGLDVLSVIHKNDAAAKAFASRMRLDRTYIDWPLVAQAYKTRDAACNSPA